MGMQANQFWVPATCRGPKGVDVTANLREVSIIETFQKSSPAWHQSPCAGIPQIYLLQMKLSGQLLTPLGS